MASLLSNIHDNLGEGIHKVKCEDFNCYLEYKSVNDNLINYKCLYYNKIYSKMIDESNFNCLFSGNNLPEIKDGAFLVNLDEYKLFGTHWIALCVNGDNVICSDSFFEHIPEEIHWK